MLFQKLEYSSIENKLSQGYLELSAKKKRLNFEVFKVSLCYLECQHQVDPCFFKIRSDRGIHWEIALLFELSKEN